MTTKFYFRSVKLFWNSNGLCDDDEVSFLIDNLGNRKSSGFDNISLTLKKDKAIVSPILEPQKHSFKKVILDC